MNKILDNGFEDNYVGYEYKTAFIYPNELGQKVIDTMNKKVSAIA